MSTLDETVPGIAGEAPAASRTITRPIEPVLPYTLIVRVSDGMQIAEFFEAMAKLWRIDAEIVITVDRRRS